MFVEHGLLAVAARVKEAPSVPPHPLWQPRLRSASMQPDCLQARTSQHQSELEGFGEEAGESMDAALDVVVEESMGEWGVCQGLEAAPLDRSSVSEGVMMGSCTAPGAPVPNRAVLVSAGTSALGVQLQCLEQCLGAGFHMDGWHMRLG